MGKRRGAGEGSVFFREDRKLWQATATVGYSDTGQRIRRSVFAPTKAKALERLRKLQNQADTGSVPSTARESVTDLLQRWLRDEASKTVRDGTLEGYEGLVRNWINPRIGGVRVARVTKQHVESVLAGLAEAKRSASTSRQVFSILSSFFEWATIEGFTAADPTTRVKPPRLARTEQPTYSPDQTMHLLRMAEGEPLEAFFYLTVLTGLRSGELFALKWSDVDFEHATLTVQRKVREVRGKLVVNEPKSDNGRRLVSLPRIAVDALHEHRERMLVRGKASVQWVFSDSRGGLLRRQNVRRRDYEPLIAYAGLPYLPLKNLRHTHASLLLALGVHPKIVQERLGHSKISVTLDTYSHLLPTLQKEASDKLDDLLSGAG